LVWEHHSIVVFISVFLKLPPQYAEALVCITHHLSTLQNDVYFIMGLYQIYRASILDRLRYHRKPWFLKSCTLFISEDTKGFMPSRSQNSL
jgi:hypothetical protein